MQSKKYSDRAKDFFSEHFIPGIPEEDAMIVECLADEFAAVAFEVAQVFDVGIDAKKHRGACGCCYVVVHDLKKAAKDRLEAENASE